MKSILRYYINPHLRHVVCSFILSKFSFKQIIIFSLIFKIICEKNQKDVTDKQEYCFPARAVLRCVHITAEAYRRPQGAPVPTAGQC